MARYIDWIEQIDINVDYYSAFIKAWIAFNSWYRGEYGEGSEGEVIEKVKLLDNDFSRNLKNLIEGTTIEALEFQNRVGELHSSLGEATLCSQERSGTRTQISFTSIAITNAINIVNEIYRYYRYYIKRTNSSMEISIKQKDTEQVIFEHTQERYNIMELENCSKFIELSNDCKNKCLALYKNVSPYTIKNILSANSNRTFGGVCFVDNTNEICAGIIEILYLLRCSLMHGDVTPNKSAIKVYEHAYYILGMVLKKML